MKHMYVTNRGKVRKHNEDAGGVFCSQANQDLVLVADGMGGHTAGDVASQMVKNHFRELWEETTAWLDYEAAQDFLIQQVIRVNELILDYAEADQTYHGMGTTVVLALFTKTDVIIAHVGDSRAYVLNEDSLTQITDDHSLVNALYHAGEITREEREVHPKRNVLTKAVGTDRDLTPDINVITLSECSLLLLCTDGLTNKLTDQDIRNFLTKDQTLDQIASALVEEANQRGGEDNITLLLSHPDDKRGDSAC